MSPNIYYYFPPSKPQFFFPKKEFKKFSKYYIPFSLKAKLFWFLYTNSAIVRSFFKIKEENIPLPIMEIKKIINLKKAIYFYNIGSQGIEQKATIIICNAEQQLFLKFAQKERAKVLVKNENEILLVLENQSEFKSAKVVSFDANKSFAYVLTEVIVGNKAKYITLNDNILNLLFSIANHKFKSDNLMKVFSHGDFCPWNMLVDKKDNIALIDWEMAGYKPLGYDLFTFIFQTNFLLNPRKKAKIIMSKNEEYINMYFMTFQINDWKNYLIKFASIKVIQEKQKSNSLLLSKYQELFSYYEHH